MEPIKIAVTDHHAVGPDGNDEFSRPIEEPSLDPAELMIDQPAVEVKEKAPKAPAPAAAKGRLFLFKYVTMLVSGLVLLGLITLAGHSLFDHWLGDAAKVNVFSEWVYRYQLYLVVSIVLFGGLHIWMHLLTGKANDQPPAARVFSAIFLTILALTILGSVATFVYVAADMLLGTDNYSVKNLWHISLDALQVIVLATLLWWYFKQTRVRGAAWYAAAAGLVTIAAATLLIMFPILSQRDAVIDSRTSSDLAAISAQISEYAGKNDKLPPLLRDLKLDDAVAARASSYEYEVTQSPTQKQPFDLDSLYRIDGDRPISSSALSYKLCATFKTDTTKESKDVMPIVPLFGGSSQWTRHSLGRHCFDQTVYGNSVGGGSPESTRPADDDALLDSVETL